jgi:hypothetical protein
VHNDALLIHAKLTHLLCKNSGAWQVVHQSLEVILNR